jgi:hypothetical protein
VIICPHQPLESINSHVPVLVAGGFGQASGSGIHDAEKDLDDHFEGLNLFGEEETDLDFSSEIDELLGEVHWLTLLRFILQMCSVMSPCLNR